MIERLILDLRLFAPEPEIIRSAEQQQHRPWGREAIEYRFMKIVFARPRVGIDQREVIKL